MDEASTVPDADAPLISMEDGEELDYEDDPAYVLDEAEDRGGIYEVKENIQADYLEYTNDVDATYEKIISIVGECLRTFLVRYGLTSWRSTTFPGTKLMLQGVKEQTLREVYHYGLVMKIMSRLRMEDYDVINMETQEIEDLQRGKRLLLKAGGGWDISRLCPDLIITDHYESKIFVLEVTGGDISLANGKMDKYQASKSGGRVAVFCKPMTGGDPKIQEYNTCEFGEPIIKSLLEPDFADQINKFSRDLIQLAANEGILLRAVEMKKQPLCVFRITAMWEVLTLMTQAFPECTYPKLKEALPSYEQSLQMTGLEMAASNEKCYKIMREEYLEYRNYFANEDNSCATAAARFKKMERMWEAGHRVGEHFSGPNNPNPPEIGIYHRPVERTHFRQKTIMPTISDPTLQRRIVSGRHLENDGGERAKRVLSEYLFNEHVPDDPLLREIVKMINEKDYSDKVVITEGYPLLKKLLEVGEKKKAALGRYVVYGKDPPDFFYPYHDPEDGDRFREDLLSWGLAVDENGKGYNMSWREAINFDDIVERDKMVNLTQMQRNIIEAAMSLLGNIVDADHYYAREAMQLSRAYNNTRNEHAIMVIHDGEIPLKEPVDGVSYTVVHGEYPGFVPLASSAPVCLIRPSGEHLYFHHVCSGLSILRPPPGELGQTVNKPMVTLRIGRRKISKPVVNYGGSLIKSWNIGKGEEVIVTKHKRYGYQLAATQSSISRRTAACEAFKGVLYKLMSLGEEMLVTPDVMIAKMLERLNKSKMELANDLQNCYFSAILKSLGSSPENEANGVTNSVLGPARKHLDKSVLGKGLADLECKPKTLWPTRQESEDWVEDLTKSGHVKGTTFDENSEVHKVILGLHRYEDARREFYEDKTGHYARYLKRYGLGTPQEIAGYLNDVKDAYRYVVKENPETLYTNECPKVKLNLADNDPMKPWPKPGYVRQKEFICRYTDNTGHLVTANRADVFVNT